MRTMTLVTVSCCYVSRRLSQLSSHDPLWRRHCKKYWLISEWVSGHRYSWNSALGFSSLITLILSSSPLGALLVPASKCRCPPGICPRPTALLSANSPARMHGCGSQWLLVCCRLPALNSTPDLPAGLQTCLHKCSPNSVHANEFGRIKV